MGNLKSAKSEFAIASLCAAVILLLLFSSATTRAQPKDPFLGTWVLDLSKSKFVPDNPPQKRTLSITAKDGGIRLLMRTTANGGLDNGMISESEFTAKCDGKDYEISESVLDTVSLGKVDANTIERMGKIRGKPVETETLKLSQDGKTLTITTKGSVAGNDYSSSQVYDKQ